MENAGRAAGATTRAGSASRARPASRPASRPDRSAPAPDPARSVFEPPNALELAVQRLDEMIESFEEDPEPTVRERAITLLQAVDAVHRPGLARLAAYLDAAGPGLRASALADPAVRLLFELYELLPAEPAQAVRSAGFIPLSDVRIKRASASR